MVGAKEGKWVLVYSSGNFKIKKTGLMSRISTVLYPEVRGSGPAQLKKKITETEMSTEATNNIAYATNLKELPLFILLPLVYLTCKAVHGVSRQEQHWPPQVSARKVCLYALHR